MNNNLRRRVKRLEERLGPGPKPPEFVWVFVPGCDRSGEWNVAHDQGENDTRADFQDPEPGSILCVSWVPARGRNSLTSGERIVRDWSRRGSASFCARERITKDPADTGRRLELRSDLAARIQDTEDDFERESKQPDSIMYLGKYNPDYQA
jgi:hypothetical protein